MVTAKPLTGEQLHKKGRWTYAFLNQKEFWVDRNLNRRKIREMDLRYAGNVCRFLLKRKQQWFWLYAIGEAILQDKRAQIIGTSDDFEVPSLLDPYDEKPEMTDEDYDAWMRSTALYQRLERQSQLRITL